jgi:hypothetical protein
MTHFKKSKFVTEKMNLLINSITIIHSIAWRHCIILQKENFTLNTEFQMETNKREIHFF